jgi:integrase
VPAARAVVFPTGSGTARDKDNLRGRVLVPVVKLANELLRRRGQRLLSERLTPHKLRHTTASIHAALGTNPVSAKRQMGHTRYEFTLSAYSHELASDPRQRERLIKLINR